MKMVKKMKITNGSFHSPNLLSAAAGKQLREATRKRRRREEGASMSLRVRLFCHALKGHVFRRAAITPSVRLRVAPRRPEEQEGAAGWMSEERMQGVPATAAAAGDSSSQRVHAPTGYPTSGKYFQSKTAKRIEHPN